MSTSTSRGPQGSRGSRGGQGRRGSRLRKATALVPLALLSAAVTANLVGVGFSSVSLAGDRTKTPTLPDGTTVPSQAIQAPASVSTGDSLGLGVGTADAEIVSTSSTAGIPSAALSAYQRAETVMNAADPSCHLDWQLIAAIGRVESNHGRADGNVLNDAGIATPGIYGIELNGQNGTQAVADSDAGQYDHDTTYDRAVGPMQFLPSTWSVVGVDADGDGARNPQDINDAALATAVYLCSGTDDLSTTSGERSAVFRYNHSESYVDLVLAIAQSYTDGDFTSIPNGTVLAGPITRFSAPAFPTNTPKPDQKLVHIGPSQTAKPTTKPTPKPTSRPTSATPTSQPTQSSKPSQTSKPDPVKTTSKPTSLPTVSLPALPTTSFGPVDQTLTLVQATAQCTLDGLSSALQPTAFQACVYKYMHPNG